MEDGKGALGSPFAEFCNERLQEYMCAAEIGIPTRMLILGVEDKGQDAYYFAQRGFQVTAIDREAEPEHAVFQSGDARFLRLSLDEFFKLPDARQSFFHAVYSRILHKLSDVTREVVLRDSFYLLCPGGWLMLDLEQADTPSEEAAGAWHLQLVHSCEYGGFMQSIFQK